MFPRDVTWECYQIRPKLLLMMDRKSYMGFHLAPSIQGHTCFQWAVSQTISKIDTWLLLTTERKSYMRFHLAPSIWSWMTLKGQIKVKYFKKGLAFRISYIVSR